MEYWTTKLVRETGPEDLDGRLSGPSDAARATATLLAEADREHLLAFYLDAQHRIIGYHTVSVGTLDASLIHPREVFKAAILASSAAVIVAHNHPSGDPTPSPEDRAVTRQLEEAGRMIGIPLLDHVVVGTEGRWQSVNAD